MKTTSWLTFIINYARVNFIMITQVELDEVTDVLKAE